MPAKKIISFIFGSICIGIISIILIKTISLAENFFTKISAEWKYTPILLTPTGFLMIAFLVRRYFQGAEGSGIPQVMNALKLPDDSSDFNFYLSARIFLGKLLMIPAYICGGSLGFEGPAVQMGASILNLFYEKLKLSTEHIRYAFILSGAAAGLGTTLSAPLTGFIFVLEEFSRFYTKKYNNYILAAVIFSGYIGYVIFGHYTFLSHSAIDHTSHNLQSINGCIFIFICGLIGGVTGSLFSMSLIYLIKKFADITRKNPLFLALIMGLLVGLINYFTQSTIAGSGESISRDIMLGHFVPLIYAPLKMLATLATYLSGCPTGLFTPSIAIGSILSQLVLPMLPADVHPHVIVILMIAAYLCGVLQARLTSCVLIMEITGQDALLLPLIATTLIAKSAASFILKIPLYQSLSLLIKTRVE